MQNTSRNDLQGTSQSKTLSLEDILRQLGPIKDVFFEPFQPEESIEARAVLPPSFPARPHPWDYFTLFFTPELFETITTNTNRYAGLQRMQVRQEFAREQRAQ